MRRIRRCQPQQLGQLGKCGQAHGRHGRQAGLVGAGRSIKHPGRNLQPTIPARPGQRAAERNAICPRDRLMNGDLKPIPGMPRIQQLPKDGPVGVLKPCSTTRSVHTHPWAIDRLRRKSSYQVCQCYPAVPAQPGHIPRSWPCCTNILLGPPNGGWTQPKSSYVLMQALRGDISSLGLLKGIRCSSKRPSGCVLASWATSVGAEINSTA